MRKNFGEPWAIERKQQIYFQCKPGFWLAEIDGSIKEYGGNIVCSSEINPKWVLDNPDIAYRHPVGSVACITEGSD